jgi:mRNA-degrading endonuclease RelE of RelBE toxin-antitoxin system
LTFELRYHPDVRDVDIPKLNKTLKKRIKKAIEERLSVPPPPIWRATQKNSQGILETKSR